MLLAAAAAAAVPLLSALKAYIAARTAGAEQSRILCRPTSEPAGCDACKYVLLLRRESADDYIYTGSMTRRRSARIVSSVVHSSIAYLHEAESSARLRLSVPVRSYSGKIHGSV